MWAYHPIDKVASTLNSKEEWVQSVAESVVKASVLTNTVPASPQGEKTLIRGIHHWVPLFVWQFKTKAVRISGSEKIPYRQRDIEWLG
jgi:hypothetical protein